MTPIINPWVFYLVDLIGNLSCMAGLVFTISLIAVLIFGVWFFLEGQFADEEGLKQIKKVAKGIFITFFTSIFFMIFIPSSKTITKMIVAQNVTYERVEVAADTVQTVYEDIMELFKENKE